MKDKASCKMPDEVSHLSRPADPLIPTIFHEPWWLNAATGGCYEEVSVSSGGRVVGRLPYCMRKGSLGFRTILAPSLTHFLGPAVDEGNGGTVSRNLRRNEITQELIAKLPSCDRFDQTLHGGIPDALAFIQNGFDVRTAFTYEVAPVQEALIWRNMRDKIRNVIRRAQEQTEVVDLEPAAFQMLYDANLRKRGKSFNYMFDTHSLTLIETAVRNERGRVLGAQDRHGKTLAAIFYVWDARTAYYLVTTRAPDTHNGVVSQLIWEAMRESASQGRIFDFDGVGTPGSALFYASFGGQVRPRFAVERTALLYGTLRFSRTQSQAAIGKLKALRSQPSGG